MAISLLLVQGVRGGRVVLLRSRGRGVRVGPAVRRGDRVCLDRRVQGVCRRVGLRGELVVFFLAFVRCLASAVNDDGSSRFRQARRIHGGGFFFFTEALLTQRKGFAGRSCARID